MSKNTVNAQVEYLERERDIIPSFIYLFIYFWSLSTVLYFFKAGDDSSVFRILIHFLLFLPLNMLFSVIEYTDFIDQYSSLTEIFSSFPEVAS